MVLEIYSLFYDTRVYIVSEIDFSQELYISDNENLNTFVRKRYNYFWNTLSTVLTKELYLQILNSNLVDRGNFIYQKGNKRKRY